MSGIITFMMCVHTSVRMVMCLVICIPHIGGYTVSDSSADWHRASELCDNMLIMSSEAVVSLADVIPEDTTLWVGARGKLEGLVSWDGCVRSNGQVHPNATFPDNSAARCLGYCSLHFALQGEKCYCLKDLKSLSPTSSVCNISCPGNLHDRCGGDGETMSIYMKYTPHENHFAEHSENDRLCVSVRRKGEADLNWEYQSCDSRRPRGYLCQIGSEHTAAVDSQSVNWSKADSLCRKKEGRIQFDHRKARMKHRVAYWTSIRRSFSVKWTNHQDSGYPLCGAVKKQANGRISLTVKSCNTKLKYVCNTNTKHKDSEESDSTIYVIVVIVAVVIVTAAVVIGCVLWKKRVCMKRPRTQSFSNTLYCDIIPSKSQPPLPSRPSQETVPVYSNPYDQRGPVQGNPSKLVNQTAENVENHANNHKQVRPAGYDYVDVGDVGTSMSSQITDTNGQGNGSAVTRKMEQMSQMESKRHQDPSTNDYDTTTINIQAQSKTPAELSPNVYDTTTSVRVRMQASEHQMEQKSEGSENPVENTNEYDTTTLNSQIKLKSQTGSKGNMNDTSATSIRDGTQASVTQGGNVYDTTTTTDGQNKGKPTFTVIDDSASGLKTRNEYSVIGDA